MYVRPKLTFFSFFPVFLSTFPLGHLGTQIGPRKVIFGHFNDFGHFPIEIPIEVKKITDRVVLQRKQKVFRNL